MGDLHKGMGARFEVRLLQPDGAPIAMLTKWAHLQYTLAVNGAGWVLMKMTSDFDFTLPDVDLLIEIWRAPDADSPLVWECTGFMRKWKVQRLGRTTEAVIEGPNQVGLLARKIIAYTGGQAKSEKAAAGDDVMKELVREAMGPDAGNDPYGRSRIQDGFTIAANATVGSTFNGSLEWLNLLKVLNDISDHQHAKDTPIYFDVIRIDSGEFQFRTYPDQLGLDRTFGPNQITFGEDFGNMENPLWEEDWSQERNIIYGGGQGVDAARTIDPEKDLGRLYRTKWNRREAFQDARGESTTLGVARKAFARLVKSRPRRFLSGRLLSIPGSLYGKDWSFGDKVNAEAFGHIFSGMPRVLTVAVDDLGNEEIDATIEAESSIIP